MKHKEDAVIFECDRKRLVGIVHGADSATTGVLIIVGGPQYRVGSHRQFLLLARYLANNNVPVMRFDYRGMGDAEGEICTFENVNNDVRAALGVFFKKSPSLQSVVLWGLCDAASAALFYGHTDSRVKGMILLNPWVRTEAGQAKAYLRHYYFQRLFDKGFWRKVISGKFDIEKSLTSLLEFFNKSSGGKAEKSNLSELDDVSKPSCSSIPLPERMYESLERFQGSVSIIISGNDLTAAEFEDMVKASKSWQKLLQTKEVEFQYLPEANHTFSREAWRNQVAKYSLQQVLR